MSDGLTIHPVSRDDWPRALPILFSTFPADEVGERIASTLAAVDAGQLSLDGLIWARREGEPVAAALSMPQPDGISLVWPPVVVAGHEDDAAAEALLAHITADLDAQGVKLSQVLIDTLDDREQTRLVRHGYRQQTELFFLGRTLTDSLPPLPEVPLAAVSLAECADRRRFEAVLQGTYQGTCDCPWLSGFRTAAEALDCHRQSGCHDPALWRVYTIEGRDAGLCLLSDHPDQDAIELIYFGVVPEFRGRGLGRSILVQSLHAAAARGRSVLFLAVDAENRYANALYEALGFGELFRRRALFRTRQPLARE